jgi:glycosyltransferase involved in cell wall biosynthesis
MDSGRSASVQIILGTYNGAHWIDELLNSILQQDYEEWEIIVRDDGSTDETVEILRVWQANLGHKMRFLPDSGVTNLGGKYNIPRLLEFSTAKYVIFAGQDDVWEPNRISITIQAFNKAEKANNVSTPIVVCSDCKVVDSNLQPISPSWWAWARINPYRIERLPDIAMETPVLGAAMAVNRAAINETLPIPAGFHDADAWFAMVAVAFGKLVILDKPTIRYRRHGSNVSKDPFGGTLAAAIRKTLADPMAPRRRLHTVLFEESVPQAAAFANRYAERLSESDRDALSTLGRLKSLGPAGRRFAVLRHRLWYGSRLKNFGMFILL